MLHNRKGSPGDTGGKTGCTTWAFRGLFLFSVLFNFRQLSMSGKAPSVIMAACAPCAPCPPAALACPTCPVATVVDTPVDGGAVDQGIFSFADQLASFMSKMTACQPRPYPPDAPGSCKKVNGGTDKFKKHGYQNVYSKYVWPQRNKALRILEIGIGCQVQHMSYYLWLTLLPNSHIFNADLPYCATRARADLEKNASKAHQARVTILHGNTGNKDDLARWVDEVHSAGGGGGVDVVVDDGAHTNFHQLHALEHLWPLLNPGGMFIIEDLQLARKWPKGEDAPGSATYQDNHYGLSATELFAALIIELAERELIGEKDKERWPRYVPFPAPELNLVLSGLKSVDCFPSVCVLVKCGLDEYGGACYGPPTHDGK